MSLDYFGVDEFGFDYGSLLQAAGNLTTGIVSSVEESQKQEKASSEQTKALDTAVQADIAASNTAAQAMVSAQLKSASAKKDAAAAQAAAQAAAGAGAGLSPESAKSRQDTADKMLANATARAQAKPKDGYLAATVKAWTQTVNKLHDGGSLEEKKGKKTSDEGWLTRRVVGPIPGYGVLVGGAGLLGGIGIVVKKIFFK
jgi:hypothetical protein